MGIFTYFDLSNTAFQGSIIATTVAALLILVMLGFNEYERYIRIKELGDNEKMIYYINTNYRMLSYTLLFLVGYVLGSFFVNIVTESVFYFIEYGYIICIIGADLTFLYYVLAFSMHISKRFEKIIRWFFTITAAIVIIFYGKDTPVTYSVTSQGFVDYTIESWYLDLLLFWVLADVSAVILLLISLTYWSRKQLSTFEKIRLLTMAIGFGLATFIGFLVTKYTGDDILLSVQLSNIGNVISTLIFSSGPIINYIMHIRSEKKEKIKKR